MESTKTPLQNLLRLRRSPWWPRLDMAHCSRLRTALFGLSAVLWASPGFAQTSTSTSTSTTTGLATIDFTLVLQRQGGNSWFSLTTAEAATYLNQARCQCATPVQVLVQMASASRSKLSSLTAAGTNARLYVGNACAQLNSAGNAPQCPETAKLGQLDGLSALSVNGSWAVETTVDKLFAAAGDCSATLATTIWLWIDSTGRGYPDSGVAAANAPELGISLDGMPPQAPSGITVEGGDQALMVSWTPLSAADWPDLAGYLVFCMSGDGLQLFNPSYYSSQYLTGQILCSASTPPTSTPGTTSSAAGNTTAVEVAAPAVFQNLYSNYLCSGLLPPTQTGVRLGTLQNGISYTVGVAAVDSHGNPSPIESGFVQAPVATGGTNGGDTGGDAGGDAGGDPPGATGGATGGTNVGLGNSGCGCRLAGVDRSAVPWGAMLALGVASRLRCRGKRQRQSSR